MFTKNATDVRKNWSSVIDEATYEKPVFIKRNRNQLCLVNLELIKDSLSSFTFTASMTTNENESVTLTSNEFGISETGENLSVAKNLLSESILKYANNFYNDFSYWSAIPNRKLQIPYVIKAIIEAKAENIRQILTITE